MKKTSNSNNETSGAVLDLDFLKMLESGCDFDEDDVWEDLLCENRNEVVINGKKAYYSTYISGNNLCIKFE